MAEANVAIDRSESIIKGGCLGNCGNTPQFTCYICLRDEVEPPVRYCGQACCKDIWRSHKQGHRAGGRVQDSVDALEAQKEAESRQQALTDVLAQKRKVIQQSKALYIQETSAHIEKHKRDEATINAHLSTIKDHESTIATHENTIKEHEAKHASLQAQVVELTEKMESLQSELSLSRQENAANTSKIVDLQTENSFLASKNAENESALAAANEKAAASEAAAASAAAAAADTASQVLYLLEYSPIEVTRVARGGEDSQRKFGQREGRAREREAGP